MPAYVELFSDLRMDDEHPIVLGHSITLTEGDQRMLLPPNMAEAWRLVQLDENGGLSNDLRPRNEFHVDGPNWYLEGRELVFRPYVTSGIAGDWVLLYVPTGDCLMHYGTGQLTSETTFQLATTPTLGQLDYRDGAYTGMTLRILEATRWTERVISAHDVDAGTVTLRIPVTDVTLPGSSSSSGGGPTQTYEIVPAQAQHQMVMQAVSAKAAMYLAAPLDFSEKKLRMFEVQYHNARRSLRNQYANMVIRRKRHGERMTIDNPDLYDSAGIIVVGNP